MGLDCTTCGHGNPVHEAPLCDAQADALVYELYGLTKGYGGHLGRQA